MSWVVRENLEEVFALTPVQEGIFFHSQLEPELSPYLGQVAWSVEGELDPYRLVTTWRRLVRRHAALRTVFREGRKDPVQIALKRLPCGIAVVNLESLDEARRKAQLRALLAEERRIGLDLANGPLIRIWLFRCGRRRSRLVMTFHHIILDGWSLSILFKDLTAVYRAEIDAREPPPAEPSGIRRFLDWLQGQDREEALAYWRSRIEDVTAPTPLPFDRRPSTVAGARHDGHRRVLSAEVNRRLGAVAKRHRVTRNSLLSAAWAILLARHAGEGDVLFGITASGRPVDLPGAEGMIGPFINTLPLRVRLEGGRQLGDLVHEVQQQGIDLNHYSYLSLAEIQATSGVRPPQRLFDTVFNHQRREPGGLALGDATLEPDFELGGIARTNYPLVLDAYDSDELWLWFSYTADILDRQTVERMGAHLVQLLLDIVERSDAAIEDLSMLSRAERRQILERFSSTARAADWEGPLPEAFAAQARRTPDAVAAVCAAEAVSYGELLRRSRAVSRRLPQNGVRLEGRVGVFGERCLEMLTAILGALTAGAAYVPLDPESPDRRLAATIRAARLEVLLCDPGLATRALDLSPAGVTVLGWDELRPRASRRAVEEDAGTVLPAGPSNLAYVFFTSGSTGTPKGAMVHHEGMMNHLWAKVEFVALSSSSVLAQTASHCFDISVWQFLAPLAVGGSVQVYPNEVARDPAMLQRRLVADRVTAFETVPSFLEALLEVSGDSTSPSLGSLGKVLSTGEALPASLHRRWSRRWPGTPLANVYGPTECSDDITHDPLDGPLPEAVQQLPIGRPIRGLSLFLLDRVLAPVPVGVQGQIAAAGVGLGRGYLGEPAKTAAVFVPLPGSEVPGRRLYLTGDLGRWTEDGAIQFLGRIDHQVKVRGNRIELGEVESALVSLPGVRRAAVVAVRDELGSNRLIAYWVGESASRADRLRTGLSELLPRYMVPEQFIHLPEMPLNRAGKIDRRALPEPPPVAASRDSERRLPRTALEAQIAEVWQEVLDLEAIGIDDDFFELGGQSLKTVRVRARLERELGIDVPLRVVFDESTIAAQAQALERLLGQAAGAARGIPRLEDRAAYPLSHAQRRLWFLAQASPEDTFYNLSVTPVLRGPLDPGVLHRALCALVGRHESLRTTFVMAGREPGQVIEPRPRVTLPVCDLSSLPETAARSELSASIDALLRVPFPLERPPVAFRLFRLAPDCHLLAVQLHHIVTDGRSGEVILHDLEQLYQALREGREPSLPRLPLRYVDYSAWHNEWLGSAEARSDKEYWRDRLGEGIAPLELPSGDGGGASGSGCWVCELRLSAPASQGARALAAPRGATLFMVQVSLLAAFLHRLSGQDDLAIGVPVSGRSHAATENLVGFFVNTIVIRTVIPGGATTEELTDRVAEAARGAFAHGEYPFDLLVRDLNPSRDLERTPLVPVFFSATERAPIHAGSEQFVQSAEAIGLQPPWGSADHLPGVGLSVSAVEEEDGSLSWSLWWSRAKFDRTTALRFSRNLEVLVASAVARPGEAIAALDLLFLAEHHQILREWNDTPRSRRQVLALPSTFRRCVANHPDVVAVTSPHETLTYGELGRRSACLAERLRGHGVDRETVVGLYLDRSVDLVTAALGVLEAGAAFVSLPPGYPPDWLQFVMQDALGRDGPAVIVSRGALAASLPSPPPRGRGLPVVIRLDEEPRVERGRSTEPPAVAEPWPDQLAYVIYTSGSTGRPKGVGVPHRGVGKMVAEMRDVLRVGRDARWLQYAAPGFDATVLEILVTIGAGATLVLSADEELLPGPGLIDLVRDRRITGTFLPPSALSLLPRADLPSLSTILVAGEACRPELARRWSRGRRVINGYGPAEATVVVSTASWREPAKVFPIGRPVEGFRLHVLDRSLLAVPAGAHGELCIGGIGLARGYLGRPSLTAEVFVPDRFGEEPGGRLYRTGDRVRALPEGELDFLGRIDEQVKLRGFRIELGEIESVLAEHPAIQDAACRLFQGPEPSDALLVAYVVPRSGATPGAVEIQRYLSQRLPRHMIPSALMMLESLPLSPSGKLNRKVLPRPTARGAGQAGFVPPRDEVELGVAHLWAAELDLEAADVYQDFFQAGGHSLKVVSLLSRIEERFGHRMPIRTFFESPTVAGVAAFLRAVGMPGDAAPPAHHRPVLLAEGPDSEPPLFLVHPHGGTVFCFHPLARQLAGERRVFGIQALGLDPGTEPCEDLVRMARSYREAVRAVYPIGPVNLAGWSLGGSVAFEMALQMESDGEPVGSLTILDAHAPEPTPAQRAPDVSIAGLANGFLGTPREVFVGLAEDEALERFLAEARRLERLPEAVGLESVRRLAEVIRANTLAFARYLPSRKLRTGLCLVVAEGGSHVADPGVWRRWTSGAVEVVAVPSDHHSLVEPPGVSAVAEALRRRLAGPGRTMETARLAVGIAEEAQWPTA